MPIDQLPSRIVTPTRAQIRQQYLRNYKLRLPQADTADGTQPAIDADTFADTATPLYANAVIVGNNTTRKTKTGQALDDEAEALGTRRLPAEGASGFVEVRASVGGGVILAGSECTIAGKRYACALTRLYHDGDPVPISGIDTGPSTNQPAGATLAWTSQPLGIGPNASVLAQADGSGLTGGHEVESDDELRDRLNYLAANPPASGNDAEYQDLVLKTPGLSVEAVFTHPAILGPGTKAIVFTVRPSTLGGSRIPNGAQIAKVLAWLTGQMPADDVIFLGTILGYPVTLALRVTWAQGATGWTDAQPFPTYASPMVAVRAAASPTTFRLANIVLAPQPGQTIGFYDGINRKFQRKKILTVTPVGADVDITCDTTNNASDTTYVPYVGQPCSPWSESLDALVPTIARQYARLGPGEQRASFFDPGLRQRRSPMSPQFWPSVISNKFVGPLFDLSAVQDVALQEPAIPFVTPVGAPGVSSNLLTLQTIAVFPQ